MKSVRYCSNLVFALIFAVSLVFQTPAAVSAKPVEPATPTPTTTQQPFHIILNKRPATAQSTGAAVTPGTAAASGVLNVMAEGFENPFPQTNGWLLRDASSTDGGEYLWGASTKYARTGTKSGWEAAAGANATDPSKGYPVNMNTAMIYGPFSLADATAGSLNFYYRGSVQGGFTSRDGAGVGVSADGSYFSGFPVTSASNWTSDSINFASADGSSLNLLGQPKIWVMFVFQSDSAAGTYEGIFLDDITVQKTSSNTNCYTLTTNASPSAGGTVQADLLGDCQNGQKYTESSPVTLTAVANNGYVFSGWSNGSTANPITVTMTGDQSLTANFTAGSQTCYTLTSSINPALTGLIMPDLAPDCNGGTQYISGKVVHLTAKPGGDSSGNDMKFSSWSTGATTPQIAVTMNSDQSVTANFASGSPTCYNLTAAPSPAAGGRLTYSPAPNCSYAGYLPGTQVTITAVPYNGYGFNNWSTGETASTITVTMSANKTETANFTQGQQTCYTLHTAADPADGGSITASPAPSCNNNTQYPSGTSVSLTAKANSGYTFNSWGGDLSGTTNPATIVMDGEHSAVASFTQQTCYALSLAPGTGGTITANPTPNCGSNYIAGTSVQLTANANTGYTFTGWGGDLSGTTSPTSITMNAAHTVSATFAQQCFTLNRTPNPGAGGAINVSPAPSCNNNTQYPYGTQVQVTAAPNIGYSFSGWGGDLNGTTNPTSITMNTTHSITANFTQSCYTLTLNPGTGGSIAADPAPSCNSNSQYPAGTVVNLQATANSGYNFTGWGGDLTGSTNPTSITMDKAHSVSASFNQNCYTLTLNPGTGGTIAASPQPTCNNNSQYPAGTQVQLTANGNSGYNFSAWGGDLSGSTNPTNITMNAAHTVSASFTQTCYTLTINQPANGSIAANPSPTCNNNSQYPSGTVVTLTANPNTGYQLSSWGGDLSGSTNPTSITMNGAHTVTATFAQQCFTLTLTPGSNGKINASPSPTCNSNSQYAYGTQVQLTAAPNTGYDFSGWGGDLSGTTNPTSITMTAAHTVTASFATSCYVLSLNPGTGGTITASPQPTCNNNTGYPYGTQVQVTANPSLGYTFTSWGGDLSGSTNPTSITMNAAHTVSATFTATCYTLTLNPGTGGTIAASPQPTCNNNSQYPAGTQVQLTATGNSGYNFSGWGGDLSGSTNPTNITMNAAHTVSASFTQTCYTLTLNPGTGGTIAASPQPTCNNNSQYPSGTVVTLTANPNTGYQLSSWGGDLSGTTNPTSITMNAAHTVSATFAQQCFTLTLTPGSNGKINASPSPTCNNNSQYAYGTQVQLTAAPNTGYDFSGWGGDLSGTTNPTTITMTAAHTVTASFTQQCFTLSKSSSPTAGGNINVSPSPTCNNNSQYPYGTLVQVTAAANSNYDFTGWGGDLSGSTNPTSITMNAAHTITANFTLKCYTLNLSVSPDNTGSITASPTPSCNNNSGYPAGTQVQLTPKGSTGYTFASWAGDLSGTTSPASITMSTNHSVTANFTQQCFALTVNQASGGAIGVTPGPDCNNGSQYSYGKVVTLTATPNSGYAFTSWTGDLSGNTTPTTVTMTAAHTVSATFTQQCFTLTKTASPSGFGTINASPAPNCNNNTQYTKGTAVQVTAAPKTGYNFTSWDGDLSGTTNPTTITMNSAHSITANFTPQCFSLTTTASPSGKGSIAVNIDTTPQYTCSNSGGLYAYNTLVTLTATPADGYALDKWSGGPADGKTENPTSFNITANAAVTANFVVSSKPTLISISPNLILSNRSTDITLTVKGSNFNKNTKIYLRPQDATTPFDLTSNVYIQLVSDTEMKVTIPGMLFVQAQFGAGIGNVSVQNDVPGGGFSNELPLYFVDPIYLYLPSVRR